MDSAVWTKFGSGMGLNTIVYSSLGANCTLIEYDKKSVLHSQKLFKKFSKNNYKIINQDIFIGVEQIAFNWLLVGSEKKLYREVCANLLYFKRETGITLRSVWNQYFSSLPKN